MDDNIPSDYSAPIVLGVAFLACVVAMLCKSNPENTKHSTRVTTPMPAGTLSIVLPIHQPRHPAYVHAIEKLFTTATHPLRIHILLGVPHGTKARLTPVLYERFSAIGLPVTTSNIHLLETDHVSHTSEDCIRGHLSKMCRDLVLHLRQPEDELRVDNGWDVALESQVHLHPGAILTSPYTLAPSFKALLRDFHDDTDLPVSTVYSAGKAMEMPAAVFSSVYAAGMATSFVPFDTHLCDSVASGDVVYSARLWVHGTPSIHPETCLVQYTVLPKDDPGDGDVNFASNRQLCQMGIIVLPTTTREASDLPGPPLTKEQRDAWGEYVGVNFDQRRVTIRGTIGATRGCGTLVVFNKGQRL